MSVQAMRRPDEILFFALFPPEPQAERAAGIAEAARLRHGFRSKVMARDRMHVTLLPPDAARACARLTRFRWSAPQHPCASIPSM